MMEKDGTERSGQMIAQRFKLSEDGPSCESCRNRWKLPRAACDSFTLSWGVLQTVTAPTYSYPVGLMLAVVSGGRHLSPLFGG